MKLFSGSWITLVAVENRKNAGLTAFKKRPPLWLSPFIKLSQRANRRQQKTLKGDIERKLEAMKEEATTERKKTNPIITWRQVTQVA